MATETPSRHAEPIPINRRNHDFSVMLMGPTARRVLDDGMRGKVLAAFKRGFYIVNDRDELACLGTAGSEAGPLNTICTAPDHMDWMANGLQPGSRAHIEGDTLYVGRDFTFALADARYWRPPRVSTGWKAIDLSRNLVALETESRPHFPSEGLARLIPNLARGEPLYERGPANQELFVKTARQGITMLLQWACSRLSQAQTSAHYPSAKARVLIGLGPGLTPSGDDFIAGFLIALRALGRGLVADDLGGWAMRLARTQTGMISLAHLACAVDGQGAHALHQMLAVLSHPGRPNLTACLQSIAAIGHTSGWDAMAGAIAACNSIACATLGYKHKTQCAPNPTV